MTAAPFVSIVVPIWNEAAQLPACLMSIGRHVPNVQLIVVDGGSDDGSREIARAAVAEVVCSPLRQRAAQMNLAAGRATGEVILFLHADTRLPPQWLAAMQAEFERHSRCVGGAFRRRFNRSSLFLRVTCVLADWRGRRFGWFLGDQAIFVRHDVFRRLGGFASIQTCEDLDFSIRLSRAGPTCLVPATITSSGRRFDRRGAVLQTLNDLVTVGRFILKRTRHGPRPTACVANSDSQTEKRMV